MGKKQVEKTTRVQILVISYKKGRKTQMVESRAQRAEPRVLENPSQAVELSTHQGIGNVCLAICKSAIDHWLCVFPVFSLFEEFGCYYPVFS